MKLLTLVETCDLELVYDENGKEAGDENGEEAGDEQVQFDHDVPFTLIKDTLKVTAFNLYCVIHLGA